MTRPRTGHKTTSRAHQSTRTSCRFEWRRRRTNFHRTRGRLDASSRQPWESATSWPPLARQSATAATWTLRARQSANPGAPETGAPMSTPRDLSSEAKRTQRVLEDATTRRCSGV